MVRTLHRKAFSMIELIFAIVIIGVTVMSLPVMSRITQKGVETGIIQEAIFAASSELMSASAGYWDVNSTVDNEFSHMSRVIDINDANPAIRCNNNALGDRHRLRPGHIAQELHRRCVDANLTLVAPSPAKGDGTPFPSLHNAAHNKQKIFVVQDTNSTGYKEAYQSKLEVAINAADNNIKDMRVTIYDEDGTEPGLVILQMRSANVGEIDYHKRRF